MCSDPLECIGQLGRICKGLWQLATSRFGSSRAIFIIGLKCCGQRCDLFVFVASVVVNVCVNRDRNIVHLPVLVRFAMGGIVIHVAARMAFVLPVAFGLAPA